MSPFFLPFLFALGLMFGSLLSAVLWRTREGITIWIDRSRCPSCRAMITWYDNIPLLSFLVLRGTCRRCAKSISLLYPALEVWMGLVFAFVGWFHGEAQLILVLRDIVTLWFLTFIFLYDYWYQEIPDVATLVPVAFLFVGSYIFGWAAWQNLFLAALVGGGFFLAQYVVSKGAWIGGGDIRLGVLMGVILGWPLVLVALFISYIVGSVISIGLLVSKKKGMRSEIAFGTFLTFGTAITMFFGASILDWYLGIVGL